MRTDEYINQSLRKDLFACKCHFEHVETARGRPNKMTLFDSMQKRILLDPVFALSYTPAVVNSDDEADNGDHKSEAVITPSRHLREDVVEDLKDFQTAKANTYPNSSSEKKRASAGEREHRAFQEKYKGKDPLVLGKDIDNLEYR